MFKKTVIQSLILIGQYSCALFMIKRDRFTQRFYLSLVLCL